MQKLSVVIITLNEEDNIGRCLNSVAWADEKVVVDSGSTDGTVPLCRDTGARVLEMAWKGFGPTKRAGVAAATGEWILALDADEEVSPQLAERIQQTLKGGPEENGFRIRERTFYRGKPIRFCGWGREYHLRLFRKVSGNFNDKPIHESVRINGGIGRMEEPILHHSFPSRAAHLGKIRRYTDLSARDMYDQGRYTSLAGPWVRGFTTFIKMYLLRAGFLDGRNGWDVCTLSGYYTYLKYRKLRELNKRK